MSWIKITMKFDGTCLVCNQKVIANDIGLWSKGVGVKHEKCAEKNEELKCIMCGDSAGCVRCEFIKECDLRVVSKLCICKKCEQEQNSFDSYKNSVMKKFPLLNLKI